jgi:recombinational DNA repair protein (RecF pathway)
MIIEFLALKKIPWRETSFLVSGLAPEQGRLEFVIRGARAPSKRIGCIDIFRVYEIQYREDGAALQTLYATDLLEDYSRIGLCPKTFFIACDLARFLLHNERWDLPCPKTYAALRHAFSRLAEESQPEWLAGLVKLAYLSENGLLPETSAGTKSSTGRLLPRLLEATAGGDMPNLTVASQNRLLEWIESLCIFHELVLENRDSSR